MASDWVSLSEVCEIRRGSSPRPIVNFISETAGMPWVKIADATADESRYITKTNQFIRHEGVSKSVIVEKGDLILSNSGTAGLPKFMGITACIHDGWQVLKKLDGITSEYLYYSLIYIRPFLLHHAYDSVMKNLTLDMVRNARIKLPPIPEQKAIAHILGSLDDKIELNRQMNETLEAMAQTLFKSYFVDFDPVIDNALAAGNAIPDELIERAEQRREIEKKDNSDIQDLFPDEFEFTEEMGWIPKGWGIGKYSDLAELNPLSWNKKNMPEEISYVDLGNTNNGKIDLVVSYLSSEAPSRAKRILSIDDTIIGTVRPGNRAFAFIHNSGLTGSTGFAVMKPIDSINRTYIYLGLTQTIVIDYFAHIADGGAYPAINPSVVADLECIIPPSEVLEKFDDLAYCFLKKIGENNNHNEMLAKIRDTLLPKLMSGELRIPDAAALVDEVL